MKKKIIPFIAAIALIIVVVLFMVLGNIIENTLLPRRQKICLNIMD